MLGKSTNRAGQSEDMIDITDTKKLHPNGVLKKMKQLYRESLSKYMVEEEGELVLLPEFSENVCCYLCGSKKSTPFLKADGFNHVMCDECNLVYVNPRLREDLIEDFYMSEAYTFMFENMLIESIGYRLNVVANRKVSAVKEYIEVDQPKLLDVGCGIGEFAHIAQKEGWDVEAIEFNARAAAYARENLGIKVHKKSLEHCTFDKEQFDVATMWGVLEHLVQPRQLLGQVHKYIKPGGLLVVEVPSYDCLLVEYLKSFPEQADRIIDGWGHIMLFSVPTIKRLVEEMGFHVIDVVSLGLDVQTILRYVKTAEPPIANNPLIHFLSEQGQCIQDGLERIHKADMIRVFANKR